MKNEYALFEEVPSVEDYNRVGSGSGLRSKEAEAVRAGLANSVYAVRVERGGEVVGIGRIIGDGALFFEIVDMAALMSHLHENAHPGSFVGLFAGEGVSEFYEGYGFETRDEKSPGMYIIIT